MSTPTPRRSLADVFAPPTGTDRAAALTGILAPTRTDTPPAPEPPVSRTAAPRKKARPEPRSVAAADDEPNIVSVAVYLPPAVLQAARAATKATDTTYADVVVDAFANITDDELVALFRPVAQPRPGGMPARPAPPKREAGIQRQIQLSPEQRDWLDAKAHAVGAPSRSALVATALARHLQVD